MSCARLWACPTARSFSSSWARAMRARAWRERLPRYGVCPASDVDSLAWHMTTLTDAAARATLGARAREAVLPLTPAAMTLQLVLLYRDLLAAAHAAKAHAAVKG